MAEGLLRALGGAHYEVASTGTEQTHVRPEAIAAMGELNIDISKHTSFRRARDELRARIEAELLPPK
jgi:protein-tyrosine-phosphatase